MPEHALETLQRIQHHRVELDGKARSGVTPLTEAQAVILRSLRVK